MTQRQVQALWQLLGKHIYGHADGENQLKVMIQRHAEREKVERSIYSGFTMGHKISLTKILEEHRQSRESRSPPNPHPMFKSR